MSELSRMRKRRTWIAWMGRLVCLVAFLGARATVGHGNEARERVDFPPPHARPDYRPRIRRKWGVRVLSVRRVAAGYLLIFRYAVLDESKAAPIFLRRNKPKLVHERTGAEFIVPAPQKTGPLRSSNKPQQGRIYWMAFANPGKFVEPGDKVSVVIGDFEVEHLVVE